MPSRPSDDILRDVIEKLEPRSGVPDKSSWPIPKLWAYDPREAVILALAEALGVETEEQS